MRVAHVLVACSLSLPFAATATVACCRVSGLQSCPSSAAASTGGSRRMVPQLDGVHATAASTGTHPAAMALPSISCQQGPFAATAPVLSTAAFPALGLILHCTQRRCGAAASFLPLALQLLPRCPSAHDADSLPQHATTLSLSCRDGSLEACSCSQLLVQQEDASHTFIMP